MTIFFKTVEAETIEQAAEKLGVNPEDVFTSVVGGKIGFGTINNEKRPEYGYEVMFIRIPKRVIEWLPLKISRILKEMKVEKEAEVSLLLNRSMVYLFYKGLNDEQLSRLKFALEACDM